MNANVRGDLLGLRAQPRSRNRILTHAALVRVALFGANL